MEQFVLLSVLFTAIVIGNISVILVLFYAKTRKSRMNYFIRQLAIAGKKSIYPSPFFDIRYYHVSVSIVDYTSKNFIFIKKLLVNEIT